MCDVSGGTKGVENMARRDIIGNISTYTYANDASLKNNGVIESFSNLRFQGNIEEINYFFDNITGEEGSYKRLIAILNESVKLEDEYDIDIFEDGLVNTVGEIYAKLSK